MNNKKPTMINWTDNGSEAAAGTKSSRLLSSLTGSKANGDFLSREYYNHLNATKQNVFTIPKHLLLHTPAIKGKVSKKIVKSKKKKI